MTRRVRWFARAVLVAATMLFAAIGTRYVVDPVGAVAAHGLVLPEAITVMRVSGGVFLGVATVLAVCAASDARLRAAAASSPSSRARSPSRGCSGSPWTARRRSPCRC